MPLLIAIPLMLGLLLLRRRPGLLLRLVLLAVGLAVVSAVAVVVIGALVLGGGLGVALLAGVALLLAPWRRRRGPAAAAVVENRPVRRSRVFRNWWRPVRPAAVDPLAPTWPKLAEIAPWSQSRINAVRTSTARLLAAADAQPLAVELVEWAEVTRRRIPELVERCAAGLPSRAPLERQGWIDAHLDLIEAVAAEADRRVARNRPADPELAVHRAWLAGHLQPTPLTAV